MVKSKWHPDLPEKLRKLMAEGKLDCEIYAKFGVSKKTFYEWLRTKPEFKEAYEEGLPQCEAKMVEFARTKLATGDDTGFKYWISIMNNKFRESGWSKETPQVAQVTNTQYNISLIAQKSESELIELLTDKLSDPTIAPLLEQKPDGSEEP